MALILLVFNIIQHVHVQYFVIFKISLSMTLSTWQSAHGYNKYSVLCTW